MKIRIAIYLDNSKRPNVNYKCPQDGNPGSGGTEYLMASFAYYFDMYKTIDAEVITYAFNPLVLPEKYKTVQAHSEKDAIEHFHKNGGGIYITRPRDGREFETILKLLADYKIKSILWAHSRTFKINSLIAENNYVKCYLCVGKQQLKSYLNNKIITKADYLYNGFDSSFIKEYSNKNNSKNVIFVGGLSPSKGFHLLAKNWPEILKKVPDAKLIVIGSGKLYDDSAKLGKYNIAEESYENSFIKYITDANGNIINSVEFKGGMGLERFDVMKLASVGIVNPSGSTENCPGSAIEFQALGVPVVSVAKEGLLDTVLNKKTGLLGKTEQDLVDNIVQLLQNKEYRNKLGENGIRFIEEKFSYKTTIKSWENLIFSIHTNRVIKKNKTIKYLILNSKLENVGGKLNRRIKRILQR